MLNRLMALAGKEFIQVRRDKRTLAMMFMLPLLWLLMFGYAFNFDVSSIAIAVIDQSGNSTGALVADAFRSYERSTPVELADTSDEGIKAAMYRGELKMAVLVPPGFAEEQSSPPLRVIIDGSDLFAAQTGTRMLQKALEPVQEQIKADVEAKAKAQIEEMLTAQIALIQQQAQSQVAEVRAQAEAQLAALKAQLPPGVELPQGTPRIGNQPPQAGQFSPGGQPSTGGQPSQAGQSATGPTLPADLSFSPPAAPQLIPQVETLYNPDLKSAVVMIPGLLGLVVMFMAILMTVVGVVREREYGTMEQLVVTPITPIELILGKLIPPFVIAAIDFTLVYFLGTYLFDLTFAGSFPLFIGLSLLLVFTTLGLGLLLSTVAQNQQQALQLAMFTVFPQILVSGLIFPLSSLPKWVQMIAYALPFTHYVPIARGIFIKGQGLDQLAVPALVLAGYAIAVLTLASLRFRKRLA